MGDIKGERHLDEVTHQGGGCRGTRERSDSHTILNESSRDRVSRSIAIFIRLQNAVEVKTWITDQDQVLDGACQRRTQINDGYQNVRVRSRNER